METLPPIKPPVSPTDAPLENPFQRGASQDIAPIFANIKIRHYRPVFLKIITTFFLLSVTPIAMAALLTAAVYESNVKRFLPEADVTRVEQVLIAQNVLILILVVIMVVFASSLISASLVRPLKRLLELTHFVSKGNLQYRLKITSNDELGELTEAFNIMVAKIQEQQTRERLISQMKSEFISIAAHQLRTPLSAVKWTIKMMSDGDVGQLTPEQKEFLDRGYQVNERMIALVGDLLNVARIEEGRFGYKFERTDLDAYLRQFVERYRLSAQTKKIDVVYEKTADHLPSLTIDPAKMDLVIQNLLDNAIKYSKPGGTVKVLVKLLPQQVEVTIADSGVGIPRYQIHRLFTKFFRGDNVVRMQTEGSGLGLFIVKNIVKNHGGDIRAESEENIGTKMIFTLPLAEEFIPKKEITFEEFVSGL
jgi:signal transduction histidine kinase